MAISSLLNALHGRLDRGLRSIRPERRALAVVFIGVALLGGLIVLDQLVLRDVITSIGGTTPDVPYYRVRTQAVLEGDWLYRDIWLESPPLIVYLMLPAQIVGGQDVAYEIYFSAFSILTALLLYLGLRRWDDYKAFIVAIFFLVVPFGTLESTLGIEDESIVFFLFILPVILALHGRLRTSVAFVTIGVWTKVLSVLLYPGIFLATRSWRERAIHLGIILLLSLAVALPFLLVAPDAFLSFPEYYFLGGGTGPTGGMSIWDFLAMGGLVIPRSLLLILLVAAVVGAAIYVHKRKLGFWQGTLVVVIAFLLFYPRTLMGYYIFPITFLLAWATENRRIALRCFLMYIPFFVAIPFSKNLVIGAPVLDFSWGWIAGLLATLAGTALLIDTARIALKDRPFVERGSEEKDRGLSPSPPKA